MSTIFYYGVRKGTPSGHHLTASDNTELGYRRNRGISIAMDGALLSLFDVPVNDLGRFIYLSTPQMTIISCWDNSADSRRGSNSGFITFGPMTAGGLLTAAYDKFPWVFRRMERAGIKAGWYSAEHFIPTDTTSPPETP